MKWIARLFTWPLCAALGHPPSFTIQGDGGEAWRLTIRRIKAEHPDIHIEVDCICGRRMVDPDPCA